MKTNLKIFTVLILALTTMPGFADLPKGSYIDEWMNKKFCAQDSKSHGMNCGNKKQVFTCEKYDEDSLSLNRSLFANINNALRYACEEDYSTIFSNINHISATNSSILMVGCEIGYVHPSGQYYANLRCVKNNNYSETEHKACTSKGCSFQQHEINGSATYKCVCDNNFSIATAQENTPTVTAGDKKAYTAYDPAAASKQNEADKERKEANDEYTEQLRNKDSWQTYQAEEPISAVSTNSHTVAAQKNTLTTATNSAPVYAEEEPEIVQGEVMTLPKEYETNSRRENASVSGSPRTNVNSIVASDAEKQAQESNNPSRISSANRGLTVSGGPTVNTSGLKSTAPEKTNKDFSAQQACNIEGGTWNGNTCTCPEENEGWDSTRQICSVDAKLTTLTTDTSAPDAVNAADVKIKGPTNTTSKKDLDKNQNALNKELKEQDCANKNGRWDGVTCWCGAKVQSLDEKATACPTKEEKQAAKAQTKLEKDFVADVKKLTDAFNKTIKTLTKDKK